MELVWAGLIIGVSHLLILYVLLFTMRLPYNQFLVAQFVTTLVVGAVLNALAPTWKQRAAAALQVESKNGELGRDILGMFGVVIVSGLISAGMIYRVYGVGGVLGSTVAAMIANWLV
jgi:hypothetical protein